MMMVLAPRGNVRRGDLEVEVGDSILAKHKTLGSGSECINSERTIERRLFRYRLYGISEAESGDFRVDVHAERW
jgi:hypothetical protein